MDRYSVYIILSLRTYRVWEAREETDRYVLSPSTPSTSSSSGRYARHHDSSAPTPPPALNSWELRGEQEATSPEDAMDLQARRDEEVPCLMWHVTYVCVRLTMLCNEWGEVPEEEEEEGGGGRKKYEVGDEKPPCRPWPGLEDHRCITTL